MLDLTRLAVVALAAVSDGASLHRSALAAMHERRWTDADFLLQAAARCYRRDLEVEALARLRVHELMSRVFASGEIAMDPQQCLEVERRLCQLERIESLAPPFEPVDARSLIACWLDEAPSAPAAEQAPEELQLSRAA